MKTVATVVSVFALSCSLLVAAQAATPAEAPFVAVRLADLDLNQTPGLEKLYQRISTAARVVCRALDPTDSVVKLDLDGPYKACLQEATLRAVGSVNRPAFTAFVADKMPRQHAVTLAAR